MNPYDPNEGDRRRNQRVAELNPAEPSMSAPSPMPGKPAASYVKPQQEPASQADWQPPQGQSASMGWSAQQYPVNQGYMPPPTHAPSQGLPGGQLPPQQYGWQQGYGVSQQGWNQPYQPTGRGWTQPYPVQQQNQNAWQGGYTVGQWNGNGYTPDYEAQPAPASKGSGGDTLLPIDQTTLVKILAALAAIVVVIVLAVTVIGRENDNKELQQAVAAYDDLYCEGVYVDGIHLGGMTREEAKAAVQKSAQLKCDEWNVALVTAAGEYVGEINSYHLGMTVHVDDALDEAWAKGHTGSNVTERKNEMDMLLMTPFHTSTALPSGDTAAIDRILSEFAQSVYIAPTDAKATFQPLYTNPFVIEEGTVGRYLDVESIKAQVNDMVSRMESGTIVLEPTPIYPNYTKADLEKLTTLIGTAYTPISTTSTENRNGNIQRACELINGKVINPGETFSFNDIVGPRSKKNGFYLAIEYAYGEQREGYGGGVCQVSSTIYWAAVRANLQIVKREQHSMEVNYTEFGYDATVNYDGKKIDFVFKNNTSSPIYVITKVMLKPKVDKKHYLVVCEIYGPAMEPGVTYDIAAVTTEIPIPETTIVPDKKAEHVIYTDEVYVEPGKIGYTVDSYKVKYINGTEVERTPLYQDIYPAVTPVTYVGVNERPMATTEPW